MRTRTRLLPVPVLSTHLIDDKVSRLLSKTNRQQFGSLILVCAATICFFISNAQSKVKFTHLTNLDGLSQSTVQAIVKDKYGFMWFGTQDGLNRYDGYNFKVYRHKPKDSTTLRTSHILTLY